MTLIMVTSRLLHRLFHRTSNPDPAPHQRQQQRQQQAPATPQPIPAPAPTPFNSVPNWSRAVIDSIGIDTSTCRDHGDPGYSRQLPVLPPDYRCLGDDPGRVNSTINIQEQSTFFTRLPLEVRELIYTYLLGNRRIHVDYDFHPRRRRWRWWYRVCDDPQHCPDKSDPFVCPEYAGAEEAMLELGSSAWVKPGFEYKFHALGWLMCCWRAYQESVPLLYQSNCFVLTHGIDQLFRFCRIMPPYHLTLITSMSIEIDIYRASKGPPEMEKRFQIFYNSFFDLLHHTLPNLRNLRLSIAGLPNRGQRGIQWSEETEWKWIGPWETLGQSRRWKVLEIAVPRTWIEDFEEVVHRRSKLSDKDRYKLVMGVDLYPRGW